MVTDSLHFDGKQDPDPDLHESEKSDPDPHKIERWIRIRILLKRGIMSCGWGVSFIYTYIKFKLICDHWLDPRALF